MHRDHTNLSKQLTQTYGRGLSANQLSHCLHFAKAFPDQQIVYALRTRLSWTHLRSLIYIEDPLKRDFYIEICQVEGWSSRQLRERLNSMLYERIALSRKPEETIRRDLAKLRKAQKVAPELLLKDPYLLDFLDLSDRYLEKDLEDAILRDIEQFLLELSAGFSFVARQKCLQIDDGQMELYLRWLAKHDQERDENPPIGIILCAGKKQEQIELLELNKSGIHVAEYLTALPPKELLQATLHEAIISARCRLNALAKQE